MSNSPLRITRIENDHCESNAYIVGAPDSRAAVVIDPADLDSRRISKQLAEQGVTKLLIVLTHEHFDHMSGVSALRRLFDTQVFASEECSKRICDPKKNLSRYTIGVDIHCQPADITWEEAGSDLVWEGFRLELIRTPGHSAGGICIGMDRNLFTGDTIIPGVPTVVKLPGGDRHVLQCTVEALFNRFQKDTVVYPGHGNPCWLRDIDLAVVFGKKLK
jgi:hydroxyacylglutathione hydrolase